MPPSTSRGIGTEDGPDVSTSGAACGLSPEPPFRPSRRSRRSRCLRPVRGSSSFGVGSRPAGGEVAAQRRLERARDDVLGVGVVAEVVRDRVDRLLVAVERIEAVDAAVVEPVGEHLLAALRRGARRARGRERGERAQGEREDRNERAEKARGCHERGLMGADGSPGQGVFRRGVSGWCVESKRSVRRPPPYPPVRRANRGRC